MERSGVSDRLDGTLATSLGGCYETGMTRRVGAGGAAVCLLAGGNAVDAAPALAEPDRVIDIQHCRLVPAQLHAPERGDLLALKQGHRATVHLVDCVATLAPCAG